MIKAIFIDIDNTLLSFDAYVKQTLKNGFSHFGLKPYEEWMFTAFENINDSLWHRIEQGTLSFGELERIRFDTVFAALEIDFDGRTFEKYFRACLWDNAILIDGAVDLLEYLSQKYILCAASNGPNAQQLNRLKVANIEHYFTHCFISEAIGVSKPDKQFFERAFEILNEGRAEAILPQECVMLGDSLSSDMRGGKNAGMKTLWYNTKGTCNLGDIVPDREVATLAQVKEVL